MKKIGQQDIPPNVARQSLEEVLGHPLGRSTEEMYGKVGVVTGANKGIGLAIVRQLALQYPSSPASNGSLLIYLTARDQGRGEAALQTLHEDRQLKSAKALVRDGGASEIQFHKLDIADSSSIKSFADDLKKAHPDGVDFVINNAGIAMDGFDSNIVKQTLACNYYGTIEASYAFLPLIKNGGRLVNVASMSGHLNKYSKPVQDRFLATRTVSDVTKIMEDFAAAVAAGKEKEQGFISAAYATSKAGLIGATRAMASEEQTKGRNILINSCCPGYVNTDMSKGNGRLTPDEGAQTPVLLALQDLKGQAGLFWQYQKPIDW